MTAIRGLLIDLDGVIYNDSEAIEGSATAIKWLQENQIPFRFLTNTTMKSRETLKDKLISFNIYVDSDQIFTAVYAARLYLRKSGKEKCHLLLADDAKKEFAEFNTGSEKPDFIVVGDLGFKLNFESLNRAFQMLFAGAELIALQKNPYWVSDLGYTLDAGATVAMLEYASGKKSQIVGKPSPHFFALALNDLNLSASEVVMIGDDIESDILGAKRMDIRGVLVKTGKYKSTDLERPDIKPWRVMESIARIKSIFE
jgi:HAD superfamily hydrolase (TIGR01458 family)